MNLYARTIYRSLFWALAASLALTQGCILGDDFGEAEHPQTTPDTGRDAGPVEDTVADVDAHIPDAPIARDADDGGGPGDVGDVESYQPIVTTAEQCATPPTVFQVNQGVFGTANGAFFGRDHPTVYDIGQASVDAIDQIWRGHAIAVATTTSDNQLAVGWGSIDVLDLDTSSESGAPVQTAPMKFAGGTIVPLASGASADPIIVHEVALFPPTEGMISGTDKYQVYNFLVFTNAGTYGCKIRGRPEGARLVEPSTHCEHRGLLDAKLHPANLSPTRSFEWLPVRGTGRSEFVGVVRGGDFGTTYALVHFDPHSHLFGDVVALQADDTVQWTSDSMPFFTAAHLAWGWPDYANNYPLVYMLDHRQDTRAVELAYTPRDDGSEGYFESPRASELPLPPTAELMEGRFAFTYRLTGSPTDEDEAHVPGFVSLDSRRRGVIFGRDELVAGSNWQIYENGEITKLWSFPNGGPPLLAFAYGNTHNRLELANWDLGSELSVGGAITNRDHGVSGIDEVTTHSTWYYSATSFDAAGYQGLLGFTARDATSRHLYLLGVSNVRDAHSICPQP